MDDAVAEMLFVSLKTEQTEGASYADRLGVTRALPTTSNDSTIQSACIRPEAISAQWVRICFRYERGDGIIHRSTEQGDSPSMRAIVLEGQGGRLVFELQEKADSQGFVEYQMLIELDDSVGASFSRTQVSGVRLQELERLVRHVRAHVGPNTQHSIEPSDVFIPLECGFQLQCLSGDQECWEDGYFVMNWMLYAGAPDRNPDVYVGCSLRVLVSDALAWCMSLEGLKNELSTPEC